MNKKYLEAMSEWAKALQDYTDAGGHLLSPMTHTDPSYIRSATQTLRMAAESLKQTGDQS